MTGTIASRLAIAVASASFLAAACASVAAQPASPAQASKPAAAWKAKNLTVFPADIPRDQLIAAMKNFSTALGVDCTFCHANGADGKLDPASDAKKEKAAARWMMTMVKRLNEQDFKVTDWKDTKVTCYTCHRGDAHPLTAPLPPGAKPKPHTH